ncbi:MAG: phage/plasmid primase, P4 family [Pseudomonadota bacterium]
MSELLAAALDYARAGWPVFPCNPMPDVASTKTKKAKSPLVGNDRDANLNPIPKTGGLYKATCDEKQIRAWWAKWPKALIGMPTGKASGVFVVDLDPRGDETLEDVEQRLAAAVGELPPGLRAITQSGGAHYYFKLPQGEETPRNSAKKLPGVDWRGDGGYVIVPPSMMLDGKGYHWSLGPDEGEAADAPPMLLDLIYQRGKFARHASSPGSAGTAFSGPAGPRSVSASDRGDEAVRKYVQKALDNGAAEVLSAAEGTRGSTLNAVAFSLGKFVAAGALSEREVWAALRDSADANGMSAVDGDKETDAKIRRGMDSGKANGGDARKRLEEIRSEAEARAGRRRAGPPAHDTIPDGPPGPKEHLRLVGGTEHGGDDPEDETGVSSEIVRACSELDTSDTDNGKRLLAHFGDDLAVLAMDGAVGGDWLSWCGTHWDMSGGLAGAQEKAKRVGDLVGLESHYIVETPEETKVIDAAETAGFSREQLDQAFLTVSDFPEPVKPAVKALRTWQKRVANRVNFGVTSKNAGRVEAMLKMAISEVRKPAEEFNPDPLLVVTKSHTLKFSKVLDLECPDPDIDRFTAELDVIDGHRRTDWRMSCVPVEWKGLDCPAPKWEKFLDRCMPDKAKRRTVQQYSGLGLLSLALQFVMFHYGAGANGKSVFLETLARVLGPGHMVGLPRESIIGAGERAVGGASPDLYRLYGKTMVRILEVPGDEPLHEDLIKKLTGGEPFPVRTLFKGFFEFHNVASPHMSGNGLPTINGTDNGIWRRMLLVHWDQILPKEEQRDFEEMVSELVREDGPGILAWMARGVLDYLENGLVIAEDVRQHTDAYQEEMDPIGEFWATCVRDDAYSEIQAADLYKSYVQWSEANAKRARTNTKFGRTIKDKVQKITKSGRIYYAGIKLVDVPKPPDPLF